MTFTRVPMLYSELNIRIADFKFRAEQYTPTGAATFRQGSQSPIKINLVFPSPSLWSPAEDLPGDFARDFI